ncbi:MAG: helix-turn-helix domain-containing protein [Pseudomonadota bacterium]
MIQDALSDCTTLDEATRAFADTVKPLGVRDVVYGYMIEAKGYVKHDACFSVTIPDDLMEVYQGGGGLSTDPVPTTLNSHEEPYQMDFRELVHADHGPWLAQRKYMKALLQADYTTAWTFPVNDVEQIGYGAMTLFQDVEGTLNIDPDILKPLVDECHVLIKRNGLLRTLFDLSEKETTTLLLTASGKTANDIASSDRVSVRTVELRLAKAREKLRARSTSEAIFKATNFGILRDRP